MNVALRSSTGGKLPSDGGLQETVIEPENWQGGFTLAPWWAVGIKPHLSPVFLAVAPSRPSLLLTASVALSSKDSPPQRNGGPALNTFCASL